MPAEPVLEPVLRAFVAGYIVALAGRVVAVYGCDMAVFVTIVPATSWRGNWLRFLGILSATSRSRVKV